MPSISVSRSRIRKNAGFARLTRILANAATKHCLVGTWIFFLAASMANGQGVKSDATSWPMFGGDPSRNMVNLTAKNLPVVWDQEEGKNILWTAELGSRAYAPIIARGKIFVGTNNQNPRDKKLVTEKGRPIDAGVLMAFEQSSGRFLWQNAFPKLIGKPIIDWPLQGMRSAPTVEGDRMYYISNRSQVVCSDLGGQIIWMTDLIEKLKVFPHSNWASGTVSSVLVVGDDLYLITGNGVDQSHCDIPSPEAPSFVKLSKKDGAILWHDNSPTIKFAPFKKALDASKIFSELVKRAELVNHGQWSSPAYAVVAGQPQIVFPAGDGWIYAFSPEGKLLWKFDGNPKNAVGGIGPNTRSHYMAMPVIYKDHVYIGLGEDPEHEPGEGHLWCIAMDKRGDVSPQLVVNANVWPPITKPNPNSAAIWHYGGAVAAKDVPKVKREVYFSRTMSTCAIYEDLVYAADLAGIVHCLDANSGKVYWEHNTRSHIHASPFWADGKIYLGTDRANVLVFAHGKEKKLLATNEMSDSVRSPIVAMDGVLYIATNSHLVAVGKKR